MIGQYHSFGPNVYFASRALSSAPRPAPPRKNLCSQGRPRAHFRSSPRPSREQAKFQKSTFEGFLSDQDRGDRIPHVEIRSPLSWSYRTHPRLRSTGQSSGTQTFSIKVRKLSSFFCQVIFVSTMVLTKMTFYTESLPATQDCSWLMHVGPIRAGTENQVPRYRFYSPNEIM